nr:hypothetical transcript [Hymenolepis microstoma]
MNSVFYISKASKDSNRFTKFFSGWQYQPTFTRIIFSSVISLFISEFACTLFTNQFFQTYELLGFAEAASTLGVIYCLNGHGTFKQFNLPFGFHVRISRSLQRWVAFFCSDVRRAFNFPFATNTP